MKFADHPILVIEDDEDIGYILEAVLKAKNCTVQQARNGREALELIEREGLPSLILLDMRMPVMNGWQFAAAFRAKYDRRVPIVVMTAASDPEMRARQVQADGWIAKPFSIRALVECLQRHLPSDHLFNHVA